MINRYEDSKPKPCEKAETLPPLPIIDWSSIGHKAPEWIDIGSPSKDTPLPKADIVVITWTSAEWSALDHVFANSDKKRYRSSSSFRNEWHLRADDKYVKGAYDLWGFYRMVKIVNSNGAELDVLLWKSSAHLSHPPYCEGLIEMVKVIINEAKPERLYTIGTAGGASVSERLGDTVVTNAGHIILEKSENKSSGLNGNNVECKNWYPSFDLVSEVEKKLLFKMNTVVNKGELENMLCKVINDPKEGNPSWSKFTVKDLTNAAIDSKNLGNPKGLDKKGQPLLTTDFYYIANGDDSVQYSALEMDDSIVGYAAGEEKTPYVFVRNISDPIVPYETASGVAIPKELRSGWSGQVYQNFGLYTSMNGALITWATIASDTSIKKKE